MSSGDQGGDAGAEKDVEYYYRPGERVVQNIKFWMKIQSGITISDLPPPVPP